MHMFVFTNPFLYQGYTVLIYHTLFTGVAIVGLAIVYKYRALKRRVGDGTDRGRKIRGTPWYLTEPALRTTAVGGADQE